MTAEEFQARLRKEMRPSAAERLLGCAASASRAAMLPREGASAYADWGIAAHQVAAACLGDPPRTADDFIGAHIDVSDDAAAQRIVTVDRDMAECVQAYLDYLTPFRQGGWSAVECEVSLAGVYPQSGTADYLYCSDVDHTLHVIDFKTGRGVKVYAERNAQLMSYAVGAVDDFSALFDVDHVVLHIVQPRLGHFDQWEVSLRELDTFRQTVAAAVRQGMAPSPAATPGGHCRWCPARATCEENANHVTARVGLQFDDLTAAAAPAVSGLTADEVGRVLNAAYDVRAWLNSVEEYAAAELRAGRSVPGWKLVAGRANRKWSSDDEVIALAKKKRLSVDVFMPRALASVAVLEKTLTPKMFNKAGFPLLILKGEGAPTLAPADDKRPALTFAAAPEEFEVLTEPAPVLASTPSLDELLA